MYIGGDIVRNGLVLHLDAGSERSYPKSGTLWKDLSGNGNNGTLTNGPTFNSGNGGSIVFDGVNDFVQIPYNSYWDSNVFGTATNFTISCWAKINLFMNWDTLISKADFGTLGGWYSANEGAAIWTNATGFQAVFSSGVASNPAGSNIIISYSASNTQKWYHCCFTGDGTTLRFYIDGIQVGTGLVSSRSLSVTTSLVGPTMGRRDYLNGQMSMVMLYNRALSPIEIEKNFNATKKRFGL
jgi:hypothetical protein